MGDILIAVANGLVSALLAGMGGYLTIHPPNTDRGKKLWIGWFVLVGLAACLLIGWQAARGAKAQSSLEKTIAEMPKAPTAAENAAAVISLEHKEKFLDPAPSKAPPTVVKRPENKAVPTAPVSTPAPVPIPEVAEFTVTQKSDISDRVDARYKTLVTVQSTKEFPSLRLAVSCNGPLVDGSGGNGLLMMASQGIVKGNPNVYVITYGSASPPFGPSNPMPFVFWSQVPIQCTKAATF